MDLNAYLKTADKSLVYAVNRRVELGFYLAYNVIGQDIIRPEENIPEITPPEAIKSYPSNTVTSGQSFGMSPSAGASDKYSRGDHSHGTPALPPILQFSGLNKISVGTEEPENPGEGDIWIDTN